MKKYLVIGSGGFVGKSLCAYLENELYDVTKFDIKDGSAYDASDVWLDLSSYDVVLFLAWDVGGANYLYRDDTQFDQLHNNLDLLKNVFTQYEQVDKSKTKMVFISSQLAENCDSVYGVTKRLGEVWCSLVGGLSLRLWNVYGPKEESTQKSHVISDFIDQALTTDKIVMQTNGEEKRQFIFIKDVYDAIQYGIKKNMHGVFDVTTYQWVRVADIACAIAEILHVPFHFGTKTSTTQDVMIKGRIPNWQPKVNIYDGIDYAIQQHKAI